MSGKTPTNRIFEDQFGKMKKTLLFLFAIIGLSALKMNAQQIYDFKINTLDGNEISLSQFKGKKLLIVNTASKCGFTSQYKDLEKLYQKYKEKLVIIGFPANDFRNQEPGTNDEIAEFCDRNYGVSFPMSEKISVKGKNQHPIYKWLTTKTLNKFEDSEVKWNFQKYLIDENGNLIAVFNSATKPFSTKILKHLD